MKRMALVLCVAGLVALVGCGGSSGPTPVSRVQLVSARAVTWLEPYAPSPQEYRWYDIADNVYDVAFREGPSQFAYTGQQVTVNYQDEASTLTGMLTATGIKPNFAYQIKLEGQPTATYPWSGQELQDPLNWTNKQLGTLGRWWCVDDAWNVNDRQLRRHRGHLILGYLLFDFFVTNETGGATHNFSLDSSFHVLWKTSQRAPGGNDGTPRTYTLAWSDHGYPSPEPSGFDHGPVSVYAEWEPNRPLPGEVVMPAGTYRCRLLLTEESFHNKLGHDAPDPALGGFWAHALSDEVLSFEVTGGGGEPPPDETGSISGKVTDANTGRGIRGATVTVVDAGQSATTRGNGAYKVEEVAAGDYTVSATAAGYLGQQQPATVVAGGTTKVDFVLSPSG
ncbi:MAG: carboxypeptidase-like regulatory domain-containing protein [Armatimonadota bacterium]